MLKTSRHASFTPPKTTNQLLLFSCTFIFIWQHISLKTIYEKAPSTIILTFL